MNKVYILTGGNEGDRFSYLSQAATNIEKYCGPLLAHSSIYETAAWGKTDQPAFLNQIWVIDSLLPPEALMNELLQIEKKMGRIRKERYGSRTIDLDMLFYNDEIIHTSTLQIPHPEMQHRRFALEPMNELAPSLVHPVLHKTISQLLADCTDTLPVKKI